jgi:hypothetical protein
MDLRIVFKLSDRYYGNYDPTYSFSEHGKLHDIIINIEIDKNNIIKHKIKGLIAHELTHIKEFFHIYDTIENFNIIIKPIYIKIRNIINNLNIDNDVFKRFLYLIYLSYDTEMNARISQVYHYLYELNIKDEDILLEKLKEHENWKYLLLLEQFDHNQFVTDIMNNIGLESFLKITNELIYKFKDKELNKNTKILKFINREVKNENDIIFFYNGWRKYFKIKVKKHIDKFRFLIKEVVKDLNGEKPYNENYRCTVNERRFFNI